MQEIGSTNLVPGTRTRSDNTLHVQEATDVFRRYCLRQAVMKGGAAPARAMSQLHLEAVPSGGASAGPAPDQPPRPASGQGGGGGGGGGMPSSRPFSASSAAQLSGASMSYQSFCAALVHVAAKLARGSLETLEACPFLSVSRACLAARAAQAACRLLGGGLCGEVACWQSRLLHDRWTMQVCNRYPRRALLCALPPTHPPQEQTRAFVDSILPRAQQVAPTAQAAFTRKGAAGGAAAAAAGAKPGGGMGAKEAAAKDAAAKLPKLKKARSRAEAPAAAGARAGSTARAEISTIAEASREGSAAVRPGSGRGAD